MTRDEPVGTLAEEAARLFAAVHAWTGSPGDDAGLDDGGDDDLPEDGPESHQHAGEAAECRWCPLCQLVRMARSTTPDVRENLAQAAVSLALAFKGLLEDPAKTARRAAPLEKIDLTEE